MRGLKLWGFGRGRREGASGCRVVMGGGEDLSVHLYREGGFPRLAALLAKRVGVDHPSKLGRAPRANRTQSNPIEEGCFRKLRGGRGLWRKG